MPLPEEGTRSLEHCRYYRQYTLMFDVNAINCLNLLYIWTVLKQIRFDIQSHRLIVE